MRSPSRAVGTHCAPSTASSAVPICDLFSVHIEIASKGRVRGRRAWARRTAVSTYIVRSPARTRTRVRCARRAVGVVFPARSAQPWWRGGEGGGRRAGWKDRGRSSSRLQRASRRSSNAESKIGRKRRRRRRSWLRARISLHLYPHRPPCTSFIMGRVLLKVCHTGALA